MRCEQTQTQEDNTARCPLRVGPMEEELRSRRQGGCYGGDAETLDKGHKPPSSDGQVPGSRARHGDYS